MSFIENKCILETSYHASKIFRIMVIFSLIYKRLAKHLSKMK